MDGTSKRKDKKKSSKKENNLYTFDLDQENPEDE